MDLQFPVGRFEFSGGLSAEQRDELIRTIAETPRRMWEAVRGMTDEQLDTPYRPGGWTARQVVHHLPESHMNGYIRWKLALTEDEPTIKPYKESAWAERGGDSRDIEASMMILEGVHRRWTELLNTLSEKDFARAYLHPEMGRMTLDKSLANYAWHGRHHVAHVLLVKGEKSESSGA
jgi:hypothetical protein